MRKSVIMEVVTLLDWCPVKAQLRSHVLQMAIMSTCIFLDPFSVDLLSMSSHWTFYIWVTEENCRESN